MFDEETSVMMQQANLDLSEHRSSTSQGSQQPSDAQPAKTKSTRRKSIRRLSDTSHITSPHPTQAQADPQSSRESQAISAVPPADSVTGDGATTAATAPATTSNARVNDPSKESSIAAMRSPSVTGSKMLLSDIYRSTKSPLSRLRPQSHSGPMDPDYDPDLVSRDKLRQKDAVKRYLAERIRNDWVFEWPPSLAVPPQGNIAVGKAVALNGNGAANQDRASTLATVGRPIEDYAVTETSSEESAGDEEDDDDVISNYSTVSEDLDHFRSRAEWLSDLSDEDERMPSSAYRYDSPDAVGNAVQASELARSARRRKAARDEMQWNTGLACFNARRDAWTGAKTVRVRTKPATPPPASPPSKRLSWFRLSSSAPTTPPPDPAGLTAPISPTGTQVSGDTVALSLSSDRESRPAMGRTNTQIRRVETLLPLPPPILPPANPMRASVTPAAYPSIYDKVVLHSMTPACPINLHDIIRACVTGWKRDGEWPLRPAEVAPVVAAKNKKRKDSGANGNGGKPNAARRLSLGFLGRKENGVPNATAGPEPGSPGKGIRKSLQRVLGLGHERMGPGTAALE
ncbi:hypothetical protein DL766_006270 [Monosporascus sp. MC13-8B]|uniref:Gag1-like clamp domain-containing protein n=1 Tax=Monosporascus cannonballus TaxID=155416 RepID=A0ABY0H9H1_9PEZI|nr:hypothetical protein DL762_003855 [Monosporascus cannonballus]RYO92848.1 hypothetical protein DL763_004573 [Monosporascus cannonballus]RYP27675.1 hypothetical protein DL766_006270 [Monosporascus sp. MC13-8B]